MSQRLDERCPTSIDLDCYNKLLALSDHTFSVCKPKDKNMNNHHVPKRLINIANRLIDTVVDIGALLLQALATPIDNNIVIEQRIRNYQDRLNMQMNAYTMTFQFEHIIRMLNSENPFADSTFTHWLKLLVETRDSIEEWYKGDYRSFKKLL